MANSFGVDHVNVEHAHLFKAQNQPAQDTPCWKPFTPLQGSAIRTDAPRIRGSHLGIEERHGADEVNDGSVAGLRSISDGVPTYSITPSFITTMRSAMASASS